MPPEPPDWFYPVRYFPDYDRYWYEHPLWGPLQYDEAVQLAFPPEDEVLSQITNRIVGGSDAWGRFSNDVILRADPLVQPYLVELVANADHDLATAMNDWNARKSEILGEIGRTEWEQWEREGDAATRRALRNAKTGEEKDEIVYNAITRALENLLAQGMPSIQRNIDTQARLWNLLGGRPMGAFGGDAVGGEGWPIDGTGPTSYGDGGMPAALPHYTGPGFGTAEERDFIAGGGYVGPGSKYDTSRTRYRLLQQLTDEELAQLLGRDSRQARILRDFKFERTRPGRPPSANGVVIGRRRLTASERAALEARRERRQRERERRQRGRNDVDVVVTRTGYGGMIPSVSIRGSWRPYRRPMQLRHGSGYSVRRSEPSRQPTPSRDTRALIDYLMGPSRRSFGNRAVRPVRRSGRQQ